MLPTDIKKVTPQRAAVLLLVFYFVYGISCIEPASVITDSHGYLLPARLLAETRTVMFSPKSDYDYTGIHMFTTPAGDGMISRYPPGMAGVLYPFVKLFGFRSVYYINVLFGGLVLCCIWKLSGYFLSGFYRVLSMVILIMTPVFMRHTIVLDAHMPVTFCIVFCCLLLQRFSRKPTVVSAFSAGLVASILPLFRLPEGIIIIPAALCLIFLAYRSEKWVLYCSAFAAGAIPGLLVLAVYNHHFFGGIFATGYSVSGEDRAFSVAHAIVHCLPYARILLFESAGLFFALGVIGIVMLFRMEKARSGVLFASATSLLLFAVYTSYYWHAESNSMLILRFFLPVVMLTVVWGCCALQGLLKSHPYEKWIVVTVLVLHFIWGLVPTLFETQSPAYKKRVISRTDEFLEEKLNEGDMIFLNPLFINHFLVTGEYRCLDFNFINDKHSFESQIKKLPKAADAIRSTDSSSLIRIAERYKDLPPVEWEKAIAEAIRKEAGTKRVYLLLPEDAVRFLQNRKYWSGENLLKRGEFQLPEIPGCLKYSSVLLYGTPKSENAIEGFRMWNGVIRTPSYALYEWIWGSDS